MTRPMRPPPLTYTIVSGQGGLGDTIARLPAFRYIHDTYQHVTLDVYVQDSWVELTRHLLPPSLRLRYFPLSTCPASFAGPVVDFDKDRLSSLALNLTTHAFLTLIDQLSPSASEAGYPVAPEVPHEERYIIPSRPYVVFTTDYTAPSRAWSALAINELALMLKGRGINCVLVGRSGEIPSGVPGDPVCVSKNSDILKHRFIDLRDGTTLIEALRIMQKAKAVIGLDNGLIHLAHCTRTPVVVGYSTLTPQHRLPSRPEGSTLWLEPTTECRGCQSKGFFDPDWDYRRCKKETYECLPTLSAERYWMKLKELGVV